MSLILATAFAIAEAYAGEPSQGSPPTHGSSHDCLVTGLREILSAPALQVPTLVFSHNKASVLPGHLHTSTRVVNGGIANLDAQLEVVRFASGNFERRGWSADFIAGRETIARDFTDRSTYIRVESHVATELVHPGTTQYEKDGVLRGTLGLTYASATESEMRDLSESAILADTKKILPMERTLGKTVPRYYDSHGKGVIVELRAFAKDQRAEESVREALISDGISMTFGAIKDHPQLYDQPIIYTYGDKTSVRLYRALGFKIDETTTPLAHPVRYEGRDWWVLSITPRDLEKNLFFESPFRRTLQNVNQPVPIKLSNGKTVVAASHTQVKLGGGPTFVLHEDIEIVPGIVAAKGSVVTLNSDGTPRIIEHLAQEAMGFVPEGARVVFGPMGKGLSEVETGEKAMKIPGINMKVRGKVLFAEDGKTPTHLTLSEDTEIAPGLVASRWGVIQFTRIPGSGELRPRRVRLAKPYIDPKTHQVTPVTGGDVYLKWKNGAPHVTKTPRVSPWSRLFLHLPAPGTPEASPREAAWA